jgi:hypothetical protein
VTKETPPILGGDENAEVGSEQSVQSPLNSLLGGVGKMSLN